VKLHISLWNEIPKTPGSVQFEYSADYATYKENLCRSREYSLVSIISILFVASVAIGLPIFLILQFGNK
jgi:hypothetical protein